MPGDSLDLGRSNSRSRRTDGKPGPQGVSREALNIKAGFCSSLAQDRSDLRSRQGGCDPSVGTDGSEYPAFGNRRSG
jgi:hypothetical protein